MARHGCGEYQVATPLLAEDLASHFRAAVCAVEVDADDFLPVFDRVLDSA